MKEPEIICEALQEYYYSVSELVDGTSQNNMIKRARIRRAYLMVRAYSETHIHQEIDHEETT